MEFSVDLGNDLLRGKPTFLCLSIAAEVFQLKIHRAEVQLCFVYVRIYSYVLKCCVWLELSINLVLVLF